MTIRLTNLHWRATIFYTASSAETVQATNKAIVLTAVPKFSGFPDTHHIFMIPGTPYDLTQNETLYQYEASFSSQPFTRLQSCDVDYSRSVLYMYDKRYSEIVAISNIDPKMGLSILRQPNCTRVCHVVTSKSRWTGSRTTYTGLIQCLDRYSFSVPNRMWMIPASKG